MSIPTSIAAAIGAAASAASAQTTHYSFDLLAQGGSGVNYYAPAIDGSGRVLTEVVEVATGVQRVVRFDGASSVVIADNTGPLAGFQGNYELNNSGVAAFVASLDAGGHAAFIGAGLSLVQVALNTALVPPAPVGTNSITSISLNDTGEVALLLDGSSGSSLVRWAGGALSLVATESAGPNGFAWLAEPHILGDGSIAVIVTLNPPSTQGTVIGVFAPGGSFSVLADSSLTSIGPSNWPYKWSINEAREIAYNNIPGANVVRWSAGAPQIIAQVQCPSPPWHDFSSTAAIGGNGAVAFVGSRVDANCLGTLTTTLATGPDPVTDRVLANYEQLAGYEVRAIGIHRSAINGLGQIALWARLLDVGTNQSFDVIARATPQVALGTSYCEGSSGCGCGSNSAVGAGEGCLNSTGHGAVLSAAGSTSVAQDGTWFDVSHVVGTSTVLFAGINALNMPFGAGLKCAGGGIRRLGLATPDANGSAHWGPNLASLGGWQAGDTRRFQAWYRYWAFGNCGGVSFSNAIAITFTP